MIPFMTFIDNGKAVELHYEIGLCSPLSSLLHIMKEEAQQEGMPQEQQVRTMFLYGMDKE